MRCGLLGDDAVPEGLFGRLMAEWGKELGWFIAGTSRYKAGTGFDPVVWTRGVFHAAVVSVAVSWVLGGTLPIALWRLRVL